MSDIKYVNKTILSIAVDYGIAKAIRDLPLPTGASKIITFESLSYAVMILAIASFCPQLKNFSYQSF